jgi:hypothetical protein
VAAFQYLCKRLGRIDRLALRVPRNEDGPGGVEVRWPCGCSAEGESLRTITLSACAWHAAQDAAARARASVPLEGLL